MSGTWYNDEASNKAAKARTQVSKVAEVLERAGNRKVSDCFCLGGIRRRASGRNYMDEDFNLAVSKVKLLPIELKPVRR